FVVNTILKEADLFCPNSVRINFTIYLISKVGLEKFEDFSRPALFLETYVTASHFKVKHDIERLLD
ncbi:hypothetical protein, partial [Lactiplantibacillus plantarum]|uniref:hypothetical protein n=1 Tax=Lactiplantibacillus plantarum TaxID=1590 RepID=UPI001BA93BD6